MPTIRLFDDDAYLINFSATVNSCEPQDDGYTVILDQTAFFPEEGGQTPDIGTLSFGDQTVDVTDTQIADDETITHFCSDAIPTGTKVTGQINWSRRYSNMQQHTGEHIFSGVVHDALGYENVGFHLSDNIVTMDYDGPLTDEQVLDFENKANAWIAKNVPVTAAYPSDEELATLSYRSKGEIAGAIRIVTIEGCDVCACCAPHVARTGEVGLLKVLDCSPYKGGVRLSILCGKRAFDDYRSKHDTLIALSRLLSKPADELLDRTQALIDERDDLKQQLYTSKKEQLDLMIDTVSEDAENVCLFINDADMNLVRKTVNSLTETHPGFCTILNGNDKDGYAFILGSSMGLAHAAGELIKSSLDGKCGGSSQMIQGSIPRKKEDILEVLS